MSEMMPSFRQWFVSFAQWSCETFGPSEHRGPKGPAEHLLKEAKELQQDPTDLEEIADIIFLAADCVWRNGYSLNDLIWMLHRKLKKNRERDWPDWRTADPDKAIEHVRTPEEQARKDAEV